MKTLIGWAGKSTINDIQKCALSKENNVFRIVELSESAIL